MLTPNLADVVRDRVDDVVVGVFRVAVGVGGLIRGRATEGQVRNIVRVAIRSVVGALDELAATDAGTNRVEGE